MRGRFCLDRTTLLIAALLACSCSRSAPNEAPTGATSATPAQSSVREAVDLLVFGGTVLTMDADRNVYTNGAVAVRGNEIIAVGPAAVLGNRYEARQIIRPKPHDIVLPGLVNGHGHAAMTLLRGVADDMRLMDWLENYIFPAESALVDTDFVRTGTELAALEMIRSGTTTFADMYYFEDDVAWVTRDAGLRGVLGETILDFPTPDSANVDEALAYTEEFLRRWADNPRITPAVAPHAAYTCSPKTLRRAAELARRYDAPILIHLAETLDELDVIRADYGRTPVGHLASLNFLGPDVIGAHSIWVDANDIATLAIHGVGVVHNPESNMKLASGTMPIAALRGAGVIVGLGTDGAASNNDLDMFGAMFSAALLHKQMEGDPTAMPATEVVAIATIESARALGLGDDIGSLESGKRADLIVVDGSSINLVPQYDPYSHLVYSARGSDVSTTVVDGRVLYRDGRFLTLDRDRIEAAARQIGTRVREVLSARR